MPWSGSASPIQQPCSSPATMALEDSRKLIAVYWGYVAMIDQEIGRVMDAMERLGLTDSTAVFFTCDHGAGRFPQADRRVLGLRRDDRPGDRPRHGCHGAARPHRFNSRVLHLRPR